jgi:hypothetical protein
VTKIEKKRKNTTSKATQKCTTKENLVVIDIKGKKAR